MTIIRTHVESWNDQLTDDYELSPEEQALWDKMSPEHRQQFVDDVADTNFRNACSYGVEVID